MELIESTLHSKEKSIKEFDELRATFIALNQQLLDLKEKYKDSKVQTTKQEVSKNNVTGKIKGGHKIEWRTDSNLPTGWMYAEYPFRKDKPDSYKVRIYKDEKGVSHKCISNLLKAVVGDDPKSQDRIKTYLRSQGWFETNLLPPGYYMRQKANFKGFYYLTSNGQKLNNTSDVIKHLRNSENWEDHQIGNFFDNHKNIEKHMILMSSRSKNSSNEKDADAIDDQNDETIDDQNDEDEEDESDDDTQMEWKTDFFLPEGWKFAETSLMNGVGRKRYMSPSGVFFGNLPDALKDIFKDGEVSDDQKQDLLDGLEYDGWKKIVSLPKGWFIKEESDVLTFLSPNLDLIHDKEQVIKYLQERGENKFAKKFKDNM